MKTTADFNGLSKIKKAAAINDLSGASRCSLTTAIPVLYAMGIQCCALPTAVLSNHTGYSDFYFDDYTDKMPYFLKSWKKQNLEFDAIYTGFFGSEKQIDFADCFIKTFKNNQTVVLIDPVMGDNGEIYTTYTQDMCNSMKKLVKYADIVTPNITEACALANEPYMGEFISDVEARRLAEKVKMLGAKSVVVTGIRCKSENTISNAVLSHGEYRRYTCGMSHVKYSGTGDLFASILCGKILNGNNIFESVKFAADFIYKVSAYSEKIGLTVNEGVCYEKFLKEL